MYSSGKAAIAVYSLSPKYKDNKNRRLHLVLSELLINK